MDEATEASVRRAISTIPEQSTRLMLSELLKISLPYLDKLSKLDDYIYKCYTTYSCESPDSGVLDLMLTVLRKSIFNNLQQIMVLLTQHGLLSQDLGSGDQWNSNEFDLAMLDDFSSHSDVQTTPLCDIFVAQNKTHRTGNSASYPSFEHVDEHDIEKAFDLLIDTEEQQISFEEKLSNLRDEMSLISNTLHNQIATYEDRLRKAFHNANYSLVIRELDDSRSSLLEGIFALVSTIFRYLLDKSFDPTTLPGFRDILEQSLRARRGISLLIRETEKLNYLIQDNSLPQSTRQNYLKQLVLALQKFTSRASFQCLQPPDRWELINFIQQLQDKKFMVAQQSAEGFCKYLESLNMLNQGDILQQHDQKQIEEIRLLLDSAQSAMHISLNDAISILKRVIEQSYTLYGKSLKFDIQLDMWRERPPVVKNAEQLRVIIDQLNQYISDGI
jgi:hypothetical protein